MNKKEAEYYSNLIKQIPGFEKTKSYYYSEHEEWAVLIQNPIPDDIGNYKPTLCDIATHWGICSADKCFGFLLGIKLYQKKNNRSK